MCKKSDWLHKHESQTKKISICSTRRPCDGVEGPHDFHWTGSSIKKKRDYSIYLKVNVLCITSSHVFSRILNPKCVFKDQICQANKTNLQEFSFLYFSVSLFLFTVCVCAFWNSMHWQCIWNIQQYVSLDSQTLTETQQFGKGRERIRLNQRNQ